jgi:DNA-binding transcriptional MerR regulator
VKTKGKKLYLSIGEAAAQCGQTEATLRFWETEFSQLKPKKTNGTRYYADKDMDVLRVIVHLKGQGLTLAGIRKRLKERYTQAEKEAGVMESLKKIREELRLLEQAFDAIEGKTGA